MSDKQHSSNHRSQLTEEDRKLFREAVADVKKINTNLSDSERLKPRPIPLQRRQDAAEVLGQLASDPFNIDVVETGDELSFLRPGIQKQTLRKLRRGQYVIEWELDLHGFIVVEARSQLNRFLTSTMQAGKRCVRIVHGKGLGSKNKTPVLKNKLNAWLQKDDRVLAFCSARSNDGGTGAVYVLLKKL